MAADEFTRLAFMATESLEVQGGEDFTSEALFHWVILRPCDTLVDIGVRAEKEVIQ